VLHYPQISTDAKVVGNLSLRGGIAALPDKLTDKQQNLLLTIG
jgi:hypothetical protein